MSATSGNPHNRMGRNPFAAKKIKVEPSQAQQPKATPYESARFEADAPTDSHDPQQGETSKVEKLVTWALIDVPASAAIWGLKTFLLSRERLSLSRKGSK
jgi:hypothetical protein